MTGPSIEIKRVLEALDSLYPETSCFLYHTKDYELLFAVILSAQSTDDAVNSATAVLFERFPSLESYTQERRDEIISCIRSVGLSKNKSQYLIDSASMLQSDYGGRVPSSREELMKFKGVGYKTSGVVMGELFDAPLIPVDTHVMRVAHRLGLVSDDVTDPHEIELVLEKRFAERSSIHLHRQLILFGRRICKAVSPLCDECPLTDICKYIKKMVHRTKND